jgi:hypothetical protein
MNKPRILSIDIETAPIEAYVWQKGLYKTNITTEQIIADTHLLSYAAKWLDSKQVIYGDQSKARTLSNDMRLLREIHALLDEADIVVAHNGQAFDLPFVLTRMVGAGIPPMSPFRQVDTYKVAKKQFGFTFNKLEFLARALGCKMRKNPHRNFPGMELWKECLDRNLLAWKEMQEYNKDDVLVLEEVYLKLRPWIEGHPNVGNYVDTGRPLCPNCGSVVERRGLAYTQTGQYERYHCLNPKCGKYPRGRQVVGDKTHRKLQLVG